MRSITVKLILAFLAVSLISVVVIVALTRFSTNREFSKFVSNQYQGELTKELSLYFETNTTWNGLESADLGFAYNRFGTEGQQHPPSNFCVSDLDGTIMRECFTYKIGNIADMEVLEKSIPIQVNNETVGYLIIDRPPNRRDPMGDEFLARIDFSLFLIAIGTIVIALLSGTILSRTITKPIRELTSATHAMADGKLDQQVPVRSKDEIGDLAISFNKMSGDLARSFNLRKQMTADIAHELRTPLSLIIGHAEAVHDGVLPPSRENFEIVREEAQRLEKLVNDLRTLSLADAHELSLELQPVDINKLLSDVKSHYMIQFNQKRIILDLKPAPSILKANLDPIRFAQVLTNILDNALHNTPEAGLVLISTKQKENQIEVSIEDNGQGVTPDEAAHLFDRFYRADPSRTRENDAGGSGLGLAIAKSIIEMHGGRIWVESEKGKGMKIIIRLPVSI